MEKLFKKYLWVFLVLFSFLAYAEAQDIDAFKLNETQKFSTNNHPKAKGINITIEYPKSWEAKEGERPNIVQKFSKALDDGLSVMCLILIKDLPSEDKMFSDEEIAKEMLTEEVMKSMFPGNSKLLEYQQTKYDGQPGSISSFAMVQESSGIQIGNSIVIHDKWQKESTDTEPSAMKIAFGEYWWLTLIISTLLTWGVGLFPPLLIRFVFIRRPLSKKIAIFIVSVLWFLNLVFFIAIGSQSKTHGALFLVAVASYYILRKGHKNIENKNS